MITLYQFKPTWGVPNLGQFNVKIETYLRMAEIPYKAIGTMPLTAPKGKLPFIEADGRKISDSSFIVEYLKDRYGDALDRHLDEQQRSIMLAMQRLLEEHLYWAGMFARWQYGERNWHCTKQAIFGDLPPLVRDFVAWVYRRLIIGKQIYGHGIGRHRAEEVFHLGKLDLDALSEFLGDKPFFMGAKPSSLDASAFGILINTVATPIASPLQEHARSKANLVAYCKRMMVAYYPELTAASGL